MIDRGKVIKGLECCSAVPEHDCENCPYDQETGDYICGSREMEREAIELLKEQEVKMYQNTTEIPDNVWVSYPLPWVEGRCIPEKRMALKDGKWVMEYRYPEPTKEEKEIDDDTD